MLVSSSCQTKRQLAFPETNGELTPLFCFSSKVIVLFELQIKEKFHRQESILIYLIYVGCLLKREREQKKNPILIFRSVSIRLREIMGKYRV